MSYLVDSPQHTQVAEQPIMRIANLSVHYGATPVLHEVSLDIPRHQVTAVVGPSGCGKSTLLATMNRLTDLLPSCRVAGDILLSGSSIHAPSANLYQLRRRVGMVFQKANPFPLSIRQNLSLPLREQGIARREIPAVAERALRQVGIWEEVRDRLDRSALELSGGQQQRLCIARALALEPEVLLMDEPCSALDPQSTSIIESLIAQLKQTVTVVLVTHNLAQAARVSDHLAMFWADSGGGRLIETGHTSAMFAHPQEAITADYLQGRRG